MVTSKAKVVLDEPDFQIFQCDSLKICNVIFLSWNPKGYIGLLLTMTHARKYTFLKDMWPTKWVLHYHRSMRLSHTVFYFPALSDKGASIMLKQYCSVDWYSLSSFSNNWVQGRCTFGKLTPLFDSIFTWTVLVSSIVISRMDYCSLFLCMQLQRAICIQKT